MISPTATTSLMYPYLYTMPNNPVPAAPQNSLTSLMPNINTGALTQPTQVSTPSLLDHNLTNLTSMGSLQNLANINSINSLLTVSSYPQYCSSTSRVVKKYNFHAILIVFLHN